MITVLATMLALGVAAPPERQALYDAAAALYGSGDFAGAADAFEAGYDKVQDAVFLFNAATAAGQAKQPVRAANLYERFAVAAPEKAERIDKPMGALAGSLHAHGRVAVRPTPRASQVELEGKVVDAPTWLPAGKATVRVTHSGYDAVVRQIEVLAGERFVLPIELQPTRSAPTRGTLEVRSTPSDREVWIGGEAVGRTPITLEQAPGTIRLIVRGPDGDAERSVEVVAGRTTLLSVELVAAGRQPTPIYKRWWFWTSIGVAVVAATTTAIVLSQDDTSSAPPADWGVWGGATP